jgi:signal peptidase II
LLAKRWVAASLVPNERRTLVPHVVAIVYAKNTYGAMGLFGDRPLVLVCMAAAVLVGLWFVLRSVTRESNLAQIGFGFVAGGALGNVIDRITHGYVIDFIAVPHFYVFNLADASITLGLALLALESFVRPRPARASR